MNGGTLDPRSIARAMGGDVTGRNSVNVPGPGHGKADRSLAIKIMPSAPGGFVVFSHASDDPIECKDYVRQALGLGSWKDGVGHATPLFVTVASDDLKDEKRRIEFALKIWDQSIDPRGTLVERYLREQRGLELIPAIVNTVVRHHGRLRYGDQYLAGMVCLMRNIVTDEPTAIHRTFLNRDGKKIDRRMLGIAKGAAIKIDHQPGIDGRLTIGEGFESSLAGRHADLGPAWALGSAGAIHSFPVVDEVDRLTILAENDPTNRRAVRSVKGRYLKARRPVDVVTPRRGLNDFNDVWLDWREAQR